MAFSFSTKIWFTSRNDLEYFSDKGFVEDKKVILTKNYVNTKEFSPDSVSADETSSLRRELGYSESDKVVIMVSRMSWAKGVKEFCEASDILRNDHKDVKFLLVGPGDEGSIDQVPTSYLNKYKEKENFNWIGFINCQ
mgnify:CR=1 FL=1